MKAKKCNKMYVICIIRKVSYTHKNFKTNSKSWINIEQSTRNNKNREFREHRDMRLVTKDRRMSY